jgi:ion channel POLLUX/CASTOR
MAGKPTFSERVRYSFENTLSKGPIAIIGWLAVLSLLIVAVAATCIFFFAIPGDPEKGEQWGFVEAG